MSDQTEKKPDGSSGSQCCNCDYSLAFLLLRGWLAVRAILAGVEKFGAYKTIQQPLLDPTTGQPDASGAVVEFKAKFYSLANYSGIPQSLKAKFDHEALLPHFAMTAFNTLLGLGTRISLFIQGVIYIMLTAGLILIGQNDGPPYLGIHLAMVAFALMLAKHNKLALLKKW